MRVFKISTVEYKGKKRKDSNPEIEGRDDAK
jgi:hypothetical protein